ncbi:Translocon-associated protein subunit gamma [Thelohanellus kitauei]|uniref:Translocon-associated protein subunit gamma n=1 Tax=Thelohanellus kitauei TaxID=669202 RepID=A0A0C2MR25_THEKT|nr:Translocon-associated protein subunit gamma [Thelohanellus kitauei]
MASRNQDEVIDAYIVSTSSLSTASFAMLVFFTILSVLGTFVSSVMIQRLDCIGSVYSAVPTLLIVMFLMVVAAKSFRIHMIPRIVKFRTEAVTNFMLKDPEYKKTPSSQKYRLLSSKLNQVVDAESVNFSIFYNCSLYVGLYFILSFIVFSQLQPGVNFVFSSIGSSVVVYLMAVSAAK